MLMISSPSVSAVAAEAPAAVETASAEQAQTAEAEAPAAEKSSPAKAEEEPGEDYLTITLYGGDYGYFGSPSVVSREYHPHKGDPFNPDAQPTAVSDRYLFAGWYSGIQGRGDRYTEETIIDEEMDGKNIYANWLPNASVIPVMELDNVYALDVPSEGVLFAFTPSATTTYEMYTTENDPYESIANVRLLNDKLTAMWDKRVFVDANGGCFHFDPDLTQVVVSFPTSDAFSNQVIIEQHGEPIGTDDLQYLAGWATTPDASEPDVVERGTDVTGLTKIYAVWKEDSYYLAQGADQSWEKGSSEGLTFTVKRTGDDAMTFSCFRDVKVDGSSVEYPLSKIAEGSLILTLEPEYLETLSVGEHEVRCQLLGD